MSLATQLAEAHGQVSSSSLVIELEKGRPGAIVRSILGGMFAINPGLRVQWPAVAAAVLSGATVDPPDDLSLLLELYLGPEGWVSGGGARINQFTGVSSYVDGEWVWPPIHLLLTRRRYRDQWPGAMDIIAWLEDEGTAERPVSLLIAAVGEESLWANFGAVSSSQGTGG